MKKSILLIAIGLILVGIMFSLSLIFNEKALISGHVSYGHPSDAGDSSQDCFDETKAICLTRERGRIVYNIGTEGDKGIKWGCGTCNNVAFWADNIKGMHPDCVNGIKNIPGVELCLDTTTNGQWNVVFDGWETGGVGGGFSYVRTKYGY